MQQEVSPSKTHDPVPHRTGFGEWILPDLPLKPQSVEKFLHRLQFAVIVTAIIRSTIPFPA